MRRDLSGPNGLEALKILKPSGACGVHNLNMPCERYSAASAAGQRDKWTYLLASSSRPRLQARRDEARELNVNLYVEKPFRPEVVRDVLCQIASADAC